MRFPLRQPSLIALISIMIIISSCSDDNNLGDDPNPEPEDRVLIDGPYIIYEQDTPIKYYRDYINNIQSFVSEPEEKVEVISRGQNPDKFLIELMHEFPEAYDVSDETDQILVTSDIEGNFYALTKLLQGNGVVDNELNWIFGSNHLVLVGDMVDRGYYVTEVLWLIYKMDSQAEAQGGKVHFILGNHDLMCMNGDDRYASTKYTTIARSLGVEYKDLYGPDSEIGRWLRTKNAIEKIGDYLFVHGGVSPEVINMGLTIEEMNNLIKPYYGETISSSTPANVYTLYKSFGLFWYRGYFKSYDGLYDKASQAEVDAILNYFDVQSIIVGHTIVDNISSRYQDGIIAIDVHHPEDRFSDLNLQALLIDGDNFYCVDENGSATLIY